MHQLIIKSITVILTIQTAYAAYIYMSDQVVAHLVGVVNSPFVFLPDEFVRDALDYDRFAGALAANMYLVIHYLIYGAICYFTVYVLVERKSSFVPYGKELWEKKRLFNGPEFKKLSHIASIKLRGENHSFEYTDLSPKNTINIKRKPLTGVRPPSTKIEALTMAALEYMNAYPNIPAAIGGHHGNRSLLQHSINVLTEYSKLTGGHRLCEPIAVFHDIGKMITYKHKTTQIPVDTVLNDFQKLVVKHAPLSKYGIKWRQRTFTTKKVWEKETNNHEAAGMMILMQVPEFWALDEQDRKVIKAVLKYKDGRLPLDLKNDNEIKALISNLKIADGKALRNDVTESYNDTKKETENFEQVVDEMIFNAIANANINNYKRQSKAEGWMVEHMDEFIVLINGIKGVMAESCSVELSRSLSLDVPYKKNVFSPFRSLFIDSLRRQGLLVDEVNGIESNQGIFDSTIGKQPFYEVAAINKEKFLSRLKSLPAWGDSQYVIKLKKNKADWSAISNEATMTGGDEFLEEVMSSDGEQMAMDSDNIKRALKNA